MQQFCNKLCIYISCLCRLVISGFFGFSFKPPITIWPSLTVHAYDSFPNVFIYFLSLTNIRFTRVFLSKDAYSTLCSGQFSLKFLTVFQSCSLYISINTERLSCTIPYYYTYKGIFLPSGHLQKYPVAFRFKCKPLVMLGSSLCYVKVYCVSLSLPTN